MYTQCPHCQTCFRIAEAHLTAAKGMVRCGSCQSIFDATAHLSSGIPDDKDTTAPKSKPTIPKPAPAPKPTPEPEPEDAFIPAEPGSFNADDHEHIDLGLPVDRDAVPDQAPFMESILDENSPYNNLDKMDKVSIPGDLNFSDSFINFAEPTEDKQEEIIEPEPPADSNLYEDLEKKETPATSTDRAGIYELYNAADQQIHDDEKLTQNIEDLLSYASGLDETETKKDKLNMHPDLDDLEDFEKELEKIDLVAPREPEAKQVEIDPDETDIEAKTEPKTEETAADSKAAKKESPQKSKSKDPQPAAEDELPSPDYEIPKALQSSFDVLEKPVRPIGQTLGMVALIILLVVGFLFQLVFFRSYELANSLPSLAPTLSSLCDALPCRYSGSIDVSKIQLQNRDVRSHPTQKNALLISAAFVNEADFRQPYPTIAIRLSDLSGHVVATRHFRPEEYLDKLYSRFLLMEPGTPIRITLAVLDPGDDAINFDFSFL